MILKAYASTESVVAILLVTLNTVLGTGRIVTDWRIRNHDVTPVLGRGYSVATGNLQSSCLLVEEQTTASYDYDYFFTEIKDTSDDSVTAAFNGKIKSSFSFLWAKSTVEASVNETATATTNTQKHFLMATMRVERYYASVDENYSTLNDDARDLLESNEYMSFFQACGPNYIRSIRRAAEITAIFQYDHTETSYDSEFHKNLKMDISGIFSPSVGIQADYSREVNQNAKKSSLQIYIRGYGLGLNADGVSSLQARSMPEFKEVMAYAFQSMQQKNVGMVHGVELVSWVDNPQFQIAARLTDTLSSCEDATTTEPVTPASDPDAAPTDRPCSIVSVEVKKMNLITNAEYVVAMNSALRTMLDSLYNLHNCIAMLNNFKTDQQEEVLVNQRKINFIRGDDTETNTMTVETLKNQLTVETTQSFQTNIQNYADKFYEPCMNALTQAMGGQAGGAAMVKPWFSYPECQQVACTVPGANVADDGTCSVGSGTDGTDTSSSTSTASVALNVEQYCMPTLLSDKLV
mmetsp:Transcript_28810/g.40511  ORF Transcript_28810/g.40511 Transcript_28810/m.40511 type:complete len:520 (-) Transcript_28810:62-1621(-)